MSCCQRLCHSYSNRIICISRHRSYQCRINDCAAVSSFLPCSCLFFLGTEEKWKFGD
jgi:hypothetical protein